MMASLTSATVSLLTQKTACRNCGPDGDFGKCPVCYEATGLGCPHGERCDDCKAHDRQLIDKEPCYADGREL